MILFYFMLHLFFYHKYNCLDYNDEFDESLLIKPLPSGHVYTYFQFTITKDTYKDPYVFQHFRLFPKSLGGIISKYSVQELHFTLTQGLWRYEKWGYPVREAPPGAELWALFNSNISEVSSNWHKLANSLSGQFCSSLNFIDNTNTVIPKLSFRPQGAILSEEAKNISNYLRYAALPPEIVCTENLTPFRKLLPCGAKAGLSTLLNAIYIFSAHYVSLAVDIQRICKSKDCSKIALELVQTVSIVFDPPVQQNGKQDWSFVKLFGASLINTCPVASSSKVYVDTSLNKMENDFILNPEPTEYIDHKISDTNIPFALYDLKKIFKNSRQVNIGATYKNAHIYGIIPPPVLYAVRKISGYGQEQGGIRCTFHNNFLRPIKIIYFDVIPWYLRLYSHTISLKNNDKVITPEYLFYQPAQDRKRPHHIELVINLPPKSTTEFSIEFDYAFLKWTEYPPDANHGFYVGSAAISAQLETSKNFSYFPNAKTKRNNFIRINSQILLVSLPTPDFSMPYNVICLTCTVVALAFGPIHNITTKRLSPLDETKSIGFLTKLKNKIKALRKKDTNSEGENLELEEEEKEESKKTQ